MNKGRTSRRDWMIGSGSALAAALPFGITSFSPIDQRLLSQAAAQPQTAPTAADADRARRMKWWHEARFGMFIHWGLYSVLGRHEWVMENEGIPVAEYQQIAKRFKPKPNAARDWAKLAKASGQKYMVMTTKHHEGFCHFDSKLTDYCAPKQGPGRDLVAEYVEAARAEGMRVGFYYSLMDWHHPDGARCATDEPARRRFVDYIHGQIHELLTNYGKIDILWYDVSWPLDAKGWESCMTMNDSWGYHKADDNWKTPKTIVRNLITCAHDTGNYLLNIGPRPEGSIPEESSRILTTVGKWMQRNGPA